MRIGELLAPKGLVSMTRQLVMVMFVVPVAVIPKTPPLPPLPNEMVLPRQSSVRELLPTVMQVVAELMSPVSVQRVVFVPPMQVVQSAQLLQVVLMVFSELMLF